MKNFVVILLALFTLNAVSAQNLKPYILGAETTESITDVKVLLAEQLEMNGLHLIGQYQPAADSSRWVMIFSSDELISAVQKAGDLTGFAAALRIGITEENGKTVVSYTTPEYWGNAYFRDDFKQVSAFYETVTNKLEKAVTAIGTFKGSPFGSEKGIAAKKLSGYRYMIGMPRFDDTIRLAEFDSYQAANDKIGSSIENGVPNVDLVYKLDIPDQELTLYGFALSGEKGEEQFLPIIDFGSPKHTAFLPYEILVMGNEVHMLHGRYRIALSFPDLKMRTFSRIMSTPGNIEDLLKQLVK